MGVYQAKELPTMTQAQSIIANLLSTSPKALSEVYGIFENYQTSETSEEFHQLGKTEYQILFNSLKRIMRKEENRNSKYLGYASIPDVEYADGSFEHVRIDFAKNGKIRVYRTLYKPLELVFSL